MSGSLQSTVGKLRVGMLAPVPTRLNPYVSLLQKSVVELGGFEYELQLGFSPRWFLRNWRDLDVLHLHWLEYFFVDSSRWRKWRNMVLFTTALAWCRVRGIKIVYTVHNLEPHNPRTQAPYLVANRLALRWADAIHVHEEGTRAAIARGLRGFRNIHVIPHGNYIGAYPNECSSSTARRTLNLGDGVFVYLFLGQVRANKGVEDLIHAFSQVEGPSARLIIAGWAPEKDYRDLVANLASTDERIKLHLAFVPDQEVQYFFNACDVCVLPYRRFTTSGAVLLALSFARPVIGPNVGSFIEVLTNGSGIVYDARDSGALAKALRAARSVIGLDSRDTALKRARDFDWASIGAQHAALYRELCRRT